MMRYSFPMNLKLEDIKQWASDFIVSLKKTDTACMVTLSGDLGSGKTTLTQHIAVELGIDESITSPTFVIQKEYQVSEHPWIKKMIHIDAYRLEGKEDLEYLGWNEIIQNPENLIIIEWPEMVDGIRFPENKRDINISINDDHTRNVTVKKQP